jgi:pimeloyl-ACP methyl ester carboxylesterase
MPVVLVHGNPETDAIWNELRSALVVEGIDRGSVVALSPPGYGAPLPDGFAATSDAYRDWVIGELEAIGEPVDLVGHDWGGGHVLRVAMERPDLLRSWCSDILGILNEKYVWHEAAQRYQGLGGEEAVAEVMGLDAELYVGWLMKAGVTETAARSSEQARGEEMGRCILALYRSGAQPAVGDWANDLPKAKVRPGLAIIAENDPYVGGVELSRESAERAGAQVALLDGLGHWWMCEDPARGARVLTQFWASVE